MAQMPNSVKITRQQDVTGGQTFNDYRRIFIEGNEYINAAYETFLASTYQAQRWEFRRWVIEVAMDVFDPDKGFRLAEQDNNRDLQGYKYDFLVDTLRFIFTGKRENSIHTWKELLFLVPGDDGRLVRKRSGVEKILREYSAVLNPVNIVQQWCARPGGFEDMLMSLYLLFGGRAVRQTEDVSHFGK